MASIPRVQHPSHLGTAFIPWVWHPSHLGTAPPGHGNHSLGTVSPGHGISEHGKHPTWMPAVTGTAPPRSRRHSPACPGPSRPLGQRSRSPHGVRCALPGRVLPAQSTFPMERCLTTAETFSSGSAGGSSCCQALGTCKGSERPLLLAVRGHREPPAGGRIPPARSVPGWSPGSQHQTSIKATFSCFMVLGIPAVPQHPQGRTHTLSRGLQALLFPEEARNAREKQSLCRFQSCTKEQFFPDTKASPDPPCSPEAAWVMPHAWRQEDLLKTQRSPCHTCPEHRPLHLPGCKPHCGCVTPGTQGIPSVSVF